ncbi:hypothetical protein RM780_09675 [Streptomyces sp. DSM 44917]|uniref:Uncharacterized protein n=1 Tax=Streptomyces boetiae TaxID=3075541 RepID=A0ABU2L6Q0_9ACTN|nr:hypothetical protein [Streptomyces sp. DSM 44917]MDT0307231.1 hypothetical protein [Streptomyces sp. DSM 44917]
MPLSLAEFKRRARACSEFRCINHRSPERSGPRRITSIGPRVITYDDGSLHGGRAAWPQAGACRIDGNAITWLHDRDGSDAFTFVFPFNPALNDSSGTEQPDWDTTLRLNDAARSLGFRMADALHIRTFAQRALTVGPLPALERLIADLTPHGEATG